MPRPVLSMLKGPRAPPAFDALLPLRCLAAPYYSQRGGTKTALRLRVSGIGA